MIIPSIFRAFSPATLQVIGATGFCSGIGMFTYGFRQRRSVINPRALPDSKPANFNKASSGPTRLPGSVNSVKVIRLSLELVPGNSADMTQQQKIAAALQRAGNSKAPAWGKVEPDDPGDARPIAQIATAENSTLVVALPKPATKNSRTSVLMIWAGLFLSLLSVYLILHTRGLL